MMGEAFTRKPRSLNCLFFFFIAVQLLFAIRTEAMRELGLGAFLYILFNPAPISPVIPYPFAVGANRDKTAQGLYPREGFLQFCHEPLLFVFPLFSFGYVLLGRDGPYYPAVLGYGHRRVEYPPALFVKTLYLEFLVQGSLSVPDRPYSRPLVRGYLLACLSPPCLVFSKFFRPDQPAP